MGNSELTIGLVSGGFDPLHSGHLAMIEDALVGNDYLFVALNSDDWLIRKKGTYFLPFEEREIIMSSIDGVYQVIDFDDSDDSACDAIAKLKERYPIATINFYNGGDRDSNNTFEILKYSGDPQVNLHFAAGGDSKQNASSVILQNWLDRTLNTTQRNWGRYHVLHEQPNTKVKRLVMEPGQSLSMQYHNDRNEYWFVAEGAGIAEYQPSINAQSIVVELLKHDKVDVPEGCWHKLSNPGPTDLVIIEIQYGDKCVESDITRLE